MVGINSNVYSGPYNSDGVQTAFPFSFSIASESEAVVEVNGLLVSPDLYRVAFDDDGGTVTFLTPPELNAQILLRSSPDYLQTSSFENEGSYNLATVNLINRRATIRALVTTDMAHRALKLPLGGGSGDLPSIAGMDGKVLGYVNGNLAWVVNDSAAVEGAVDTALVAAAESAASANAAGGFGAAASGDADRAETAASAAKLSAGLYINEAVGRAAVTDSAVFVAVGAASDRSVDIWQRVNSGSSTLLRSYPSLSPLSAAMAATYGAGRLTDDSFVGAREVAVFPSAQAATVIETQFTLPTGGASIPVVLTGDQLGDTTSTFSATLQIVSGSVGTAFPVALGRWYNAAGAQIGADVPLTKTATSVSLTGTQPAGAHKLVFALVPPVATMCRFLAYQFGTPARPTTDAWYLSLLGAGIANGDPMPVQFVVQNDTTWNPLTRRVPVPTGGGGSFSVSIPSGVNDGDVLWAMFDSPLEPTVWLQTINARFGDSGGGGGSGYAAQVLHLGGHRFAAALFIQSAADGAFYGARWTWSNTTGSATYFENINLYVGPKPPFVEKTSAIVLKGVRDEIDSKRIMPLVTLADDSCGISSNQFQPSPGKSLLKFFGSSARFQNFATPGNTLAQSCSTVGLLPIHVSVTSAVIPASSAAVQITAWDQDPITSLSRTNPEYDGYAYLCGVLGRLSAGSFSGNAPVTLYFTPVVAPAWPIEVPNGSKLILRASRKRKGGLTLFPLSSVNGTGGGFSSAIALADAVFAANDPNTIAGFIGLTPGATYDSGASQLAAFVGKSYYGRLYNPNIISAATVAEAMSLFGWNWAAGENASWLAGTLGIPGSMRYSGDGFHPYADVCSYVSAKNHFISAPVTAFIEGWV